MNRRQHKDEMNRLHLDRMADADSIEVVKKVDSLGNVDWYVNCYNNGRGREEYIGGLSTGSYESAIQAAHEYATLPGSLTGNRPIYPVSLAELNDPHNELSR
jgi:hypothetical protein